MPHTGIDIATHLLLALYPAAGLFGVEMVSRAIKLEKWIKSLIQAFVCIAFAIAFVTIIDATGIAIALAFLSIAMLIQARRIKREAKV